MTRTRIRSAKVGDIFAVKLAENSIKCLQFIGLDATQLNSEVIRAFSDVYRSETPNPKEIVKGSVEFYAHVILKLGIKLGCWTHIGNAVDTGPCRPLFRDCVDYGNPVLKVCNDWYVWEMNEEMRRIGKLSGDNELADIGIVVNPKSIVHRVQTGRYDFVYPAFR